MHNLDFEIKIVINIDVFLSIGVHFHKRNILSSRSDGATVDMGGSSWSRLPGKTALKYWHRQYPTLFTIVILLHTYRRFPKSMRKLKCLIKLARPLAQALDITKNVSFFNKSVFIRRRCMLLLHYISVLAYIF